VKIIADDKIPFLKGALEPYAEMVYLPGSEITRDAVMNADALLVRTRTKCNRQLLEGTSVRFLGTATIGFDHIDTGFCEENNIYWTNAPGCNSSSVRQYIASALVSVAADLRLSLAEKTIGIIGVGNVGLKVALFARSVGMNVLLNDPPRERKEGSSGFVSIDNLLKESDFVTVHVPLSHDGPDSTYHLFEENMFSGMKSGSVFLNSSRGEVVRTDSLRKAIVSGHLSGAVIDVWENEPEISIELLSEVMLGTPHIAGYSTDGKANGTSMVVNSLSDFFGIPFHGWYPGNVPLPPVPMFMIEGKGRIDQEIIREAVLHSYDITADCMRLRSQPSGFEKQRGDYPLRREFTSYSVKLEHSSVSAAEKLKEIGFRVI
jgi:erythronate-4-phosphate dehydrogenase